MRTQHKEVVEQDAGLSSWVLRSCTALQRNEFNPPFGFLVSHFGHTPYAQGSLWPGCLAALCTVFYCVLAIPPEILILYSSLTTGSAS